MILSNRDIKDYLESGKLAVSPLSEDTIRENGVDLRIGNEISRFLMSTKEIEIGNSAALETIYKKEQVTGPFVIHPNERMLLKIKERIRLPNDLVGFSNIRSTFARLGVSIPPTIVDAGFEGDLTILLIGGAVPIKVEPGTRFLHLVFGKTNSEVTVPYRGKYYSSSGVTGAKV